MNNLVTAVVRGSSRARSRSNAPTAYMCTRILLLQLIHTYTSIARNTISACIHTVLNAPRDTPAAQFSSPACLSQDIPRAWLQTAHEHTNMSRCSLSSYPSLTTSPLTNTPTITPNPYTHCSNLSRLPECTSRTTPVVNTLG